MSSKLRHFLVSKVPADYPYHVSTSGDQYRIPFHEIRGRGPPLNDPDFGSPGDVYLDLRNPDAFALYLKTTTNWVPWHAAATSSIKHKVPISSLFGHPHLDKYLWCDGSILSWFSRSTIKKKRRQMHSNGIYHRKDGMEDGTYSGAVVAEIVKRMLEYEEQKKSKRGMRDLELADDEVGPVHKKAKTNSPTPSSPDSMSVDSSLSSILHVNDATACSSPSAASRQHSSTTHPTLAASQTHVIAHATPPITRLLNILSPPHTQPPSSYESMSGQGIPQRFWTEERKITETLEEANQRLTMENAKLREEIPGRSFADIGTSSDDLESPVHSQSEPVGQDMASVTLPAPVIKSFAASFNDAGALKALGVLLNEARLDTQRICLEMQAKRSMADNEKKRLEERLSKALVQLEHQQHTTKAIQSLYDEANEKVNEIEDRLLCVLNELSESNTTRLQTEQKYSKLQQHMTQVREALNMFASEATGDIK